MNNTFEAPNDYRNYLQHHGVKGMHWGIRHDPVRVGRRKRGKTLMSKLFNTEERKKKNINNIKKSLPQTKANEKVTVNDPEGFIKGTTYTKDDSSEYTTYENWVNSKNNSTIDIERNTRKTNPKVESVYKMSPFSDKEIKNLQVSINKNESKISSMILNNIVDNVWSGNRMGFSQKEVFDSMNIKSKSDVKRLIMEDTMDGSNPFYIRAIGSHISTNPGYITGEFSTGDGMIYGGHMFTKEFVFNPSTGDCRIIRKDDLQIDG